VYVSSAHWDQNSDDLVVQIETHGLDYGGLTLNWTDIGDLSQGQYF